MNKKLRIILLVFFAAVFLISAGIMAYYMKDYFTARNDYNEANELFVSESKGNDKRADFNFEKRDYAGSSDEFDLIKDYFSECDFEALLEVNDEVKGWIIIPGTNINYPICQHKDNDYYLAYTYDKSPNRIGCPFLDYRVSDDFSDFNTIIYGHRTRDLTMFSALKYYRDKATWADCQFIYIMDIKGNIYKYQIFAAFAGDPDGISYNNGIQKEESKQEFIDYALKCSEYNTGIVPTTEDRIITLSTCILSNHTYRMIVNAVMVDQVSIDDIE